MTEYQAPWSKSLIAISLLSGIMCVVVSLFLLSSFPVDSLGAVRTWAALGPSGLLVGCALFTIRGYSLTHDSVLVHRLLWSTPLPLAGLASATVDPNAMRGSIRTFGNGGFFSFSGYFRSSRLGPYRALVTDPRHTVVLRYSSGRTIVLSPFPAKPFVDMVSQLKHGADPLPQM